MERTSGRLRMLRLRSSDVSWWSITMTTFLGCSTRSQPLRERQRPPEALKPSAEEIGRALQSGSRTRSDRVRHQDRVHVLAGAMVVRLPVALALEAEALVQPDRRLVPGKDVQLEL